MFDKTEIKFGVFGSAYNPCPVCSGKAYVEDPENDRRYSLDLTIENIKFPDHFYHSTDGVDISDEEITKWVKMCLESCEKDKDEFTYAFYEGGNTTVFVRKKEDEYTINVCKNDYESYISR